MELENCFYVEDCLGPGEYHNCIAPGTEDDTCGVGGECVPSGNGSCSNWDGEYCCVNNDVSDCVSTVSTTDNLLLLPLLSLPVEEGLNIKLLAREQNCSNKL